MFEDDDESPASIWLWEWAGEHINAPGYDEDKANFEKLASLCLEQAKADGISEDDIKAAAGGDLAKFLMDRQNALTDDEVRRLAEENH